MAGGHSPIEDPRTMNADALKQYIARLDRMDDRYLDNLHALQKRLEVKLNAEGRAKEIPVIRERELRVNETMAHIAEHSADPFPKRRHRIR